MEGVVRWSRIVRRSSEGREFRFGVDWAMVRSLLVFPAA